jgi:hypothetical protein
MLQQQTGKSNIIGAAIIGISLIIALNFAQITDWARDATYHLSGQAAADMQAHERYLASQREQQARDDQARTEQRAKDEREAAARTEQRAKDEQEAAARIEAKSAMFKAWQDYLTANRQKFKQIDVIRDIVKGNYSCLRIIFGSVASSPFALNESQKRQRDQIAALWTYELRDRVADGFVQWLNSNTLLNRAAWQYNDLKNIYFESYGPFSACLGPSEVWRANRFQKRIE